jgi:hypothetical protein
MTRTFPLVACTALLCSLTGCASVDPAIYRGEQPELDVTRFFNGHIEAWGMFQDRSGEVKRRFTVQLEGQWTGNEGTLTEHFVYSDGEIQDRRWSMHRIDAHHVIGEAPDIVGRAEGEVAGNAVRWRYVLDLPVGGSHYHVDFDDWMYQMDERTMLNHAVMSKFGVRLGDVFLTFRKPS